MHRFYVTNIDPSDRSITLDGAIARQLRSVLRAEPGEHIRLFDGSGYEWEVEIDYVGHSEVETTLISAVKAVVEPKTKVTMILGLARPERIELAIQKCTELGVVRFVPVTSERVQGGNTGTPSAKRLERWQRIAIEAAEQSGRAVVPDIENPKPLMAAVSEIASEQPLLCMWEETATHSQSLSRTLRALPEVQNELAVLIGPPGGFNASEVEAITESGASLITLGERVLRSETAAITVMAAILYERGDLGG